MQITKKMHSCTLTKHLYFCCSIVFILSSLLNTCSSKKERSNAQRKCNFCCVCLICDFRPRRCQTLVSCGSRPRSCWFSRTCQTWAAGADGSILLRVSLYVASKCLPTAYFCSAGMCVEEVQYPDTRLLRSSDATPYNFVWAAVYEPTSCFKA